MPRSAGIAPTPRGAYPWTVEAGDIVRLKNWSAPDQSGDLPVNERGIVLVPTVGSLDVQGLTADSLQQRIVRAFSGRIDPSRVDVQLFRPITVTGGVKNPSVNGLHPTTPAGRTASARSHSLRRIQDMIPLRA